MSARKLVVLTYYWPPSGGSGVQRWVYFTHYLKTLGWEPIVITVDPEQASYPQEDKSLQALTKDIRVIRTATREPIRGYARWFGKGSIPQGEVPQQHFFQRIAAFIRGNFFIPDARKGWIPFAQKALRTILEKESIEWVISTGPPHSTHLTVESLRHTFNFQWLVDFRDPWSELFYNRQFYRLPFAVRKDRAYEQEILQHADAVLTTVGGELHQQLQVKAPKQRFFALPNGFDANAFAQHQRSQRQGEFHLVYTGLLTRNQAYPALLKALQQMKNGLPLRVSLAGQMELSLVKALQTALPEATIDYHGYLPHAQALTLMHSADVLINFIFEGAHKQMISGKLLEYMATGVPVLSLGDPESEAGQLLAQGAAAAMIAPSDTQQLIAFLEKAQQQKGQWINNFPNKTQWTREGITKRLVKEILR
ncbi:MAG: glycosyltransferase [Flavobacteriaceae bacterium]|nr:glycosyltransferase [Flavobacteriaceae bacterium]